VYSKVANVTEGNRPVYQYGPTDRPSLVSYLYYYPRGNCWLVGSNHSSDSNALKSAARSAAACPELAAGWQVWDNSQRSYASTYPVTVVPSTLSSAPDPTCAMGIARNLACCPPACGMCGGDGCDLRPGGVAACCARNITADCSASCNRRGAPCCLASPLAVADRWVLAAEGKTCAQACSAIDLSCFEDRLGARNEEASTAAGMASILRLWSREEDISCDSYSSSSRNDSIAPAVEAVQSGQMLRYRRLGESSHN
jgi:hypothetical protein